MKHVAYSTLTLTAALITASSLPTRKVPAEDPYLPMLNQINQQLQAMRQTQAAQEV